MTQLPQLSPPSTPSTPSRIHRNRLDDRGIQEPPDESTSGYSSRPHIATMEESSGLLTASDITTTSSSNPNRSQQLQQRSSRRQRLCNRRLLQRPLSTPSWSSSWRWSFTTFRHTRQQQHHHHHQQQQQQHQQLNRMATVLKRRTFPPPSRALRFERYRFSNKMSRRDYHEDQQEQGHRRRHRRNSLSALLSSWRIGGGGSSSHLHRSSFRTSMVMREGLAVSDLPEVLYDDDIEEGSSISSFVSSTCSRCANDEPCPRHPPQRLYNLKKDSSGSGNKTSGVLVRSSEKFIQPPTISSLSSSLSIVVLPYQPQTLPYQQQLHRFSAFWYDGAQGRSGKHQVHVDSLGQVRQNNKQCQDQIQSTLFLFGFLIFPLWWIGAWLHCRKRRKNSDPEKRQRLAEPFSSASLSLVNARMVGQVNCCMTCVSLVLIAVMIALGVWLRYWTTS